MIESSDPADPLMATTSPFLTVKEIPEAGTAFPLTLPVPETILPTMTSEASFELILHFNEMVEPKGFGMLFAVFGWKSNENSEFGSGSDKAKSQSAWTLFDP